MRAMQHTLPASLQQKRNLFVQQVVIRKKPVSHWRICYHFDREIVKSWTELFIVVLTERIRRMTRVMELS